MWRSGGRAIPGISSGATDRQIDGLVYELYGLTEEEIRIVEGERNAVKVSLDWRITNLFNKQLRSFSSFEPPHSTIQWGSKQRLLWNSVS